MMPARPISCIYIFPVYSRPPFLLFSMDYYFALAGGYSLHMLTSHPYSKYMKETRDAFECLHDTPRIFMSLNLDFCENVPHNIVIGFFIPGYFL
jgi:hypothetical protein